MLTVMPGPQFFVFGIADVGVSFQSFDHFAIATVAKKFEDLCEYCFFFINITHAARFCYLFYKPSQTFLWLVFDCCIDCLKLQPMLKVPP